MLSKVRWGSLAKVLCRVLRRLLSRVRHLRRNEISQGCCVGCNAATGQDSV